MKKNVTLMVLLPFLLLTACQESKAMEGLAQAASEAGAAGIEQLLTFVQHYRAADQQVVEPRGQEDDGKEPERAAPDGELELPKKAATKPLSAVEQWEILKQERSNDLDNIALIRNKNLPHLFPDPILAITLDYVQAEEEAFLDIEVGDAVKRRLLEQDGYKQHVLHCLSNEKISMSSRLLNSMRITLTPHCTWPGIQENIAREFSIALPITLRTRKKRTKKERRGASPIKLNKVITNLRDIKNAIRSGSQLFCTKETNQNKNDENE